MTQVTGCPGYAYVTRASVARYPGVSRRTLSGLVASAVVTLALLVGIVAAVVASPSATSPAASVAAAVTSTGLTPPTLGLRLAARSLRADLPGAGISPTTGTPVLPSRCLEGDDNLPIEPGPCFITSYGPDRPTVVVWGDSHAWQQVPGLRVQAERTRTNLVAFVMGACPPMDLRGEGHQSLCLQQNEQALDFIAAKLERERRLKVVLGGFWELYRDYHARGRTGWTPDDADDEFLLTRAELFAAGGARAFRTLGRWGVPTAAIAQAPWVSDAAPSCPSGQLPYACDLPRSSAIPAEAATSRWVRSQLSAIRVSGYIDTSRFLCSAAVCRSELDGAPVYLDELHLNPAITVAFAREYRGLFM